MSIFKERLRQVLAERSIKPAKMARDLGISKTTISKYLKEEDREPRGIFVLKIAQYLDVTSEWLYGFTDIRKPFYEPSIVDIYEILSEAGKAKVKDFALFIQRKEACPDDKGDGAL